MRSASDNVRRKVALLGLALLSAVDDFVISCGRFSTSSKQRGLRRVIRVLMLGGKKDDDDDILDHTLSFKYSTCMYDMLLWRFIAVE
mmetsp:Transcript_11779/g.24849  ORF Transcript_11779/g.24849 Transcript_11779/m.24849 type:complete len:87 (+) Transcript_11779:962-1222(+)